MCTYRRCGHKQRQDKGKKVYNEGYMEFCLDAQSKKFIPKGNIRIGGQQNVPVTEESTYADAHVHNHPYTHWPLTKSQYNTYAGTLESDMSNINSQNDLDHGYNRQNNFNVVVARDYYLFYGHRTFSKKSEYDIQTKTTQHGFKVKRTNTFNANTNQENTRK